MKCRHGVKYLYNSLNICVKCRYGEGSHKEYQEQQERDLVDDLKMNAGYKFIQNRRDDI